jgi:hypothetical protein
LTTCDTLKACYLRNLETGEETVLTGSDSYKISADKRKDFSVRCEVTGQGDSDFIKFFYDGTIQDEFGEPRWMYGDSDLGAYVNPVTYLSSCGTKTLTIQGHTWSQMCFEKSFTIEAVCDNPCPPGFKLVSGYCVKDWCNADFQCPINSKRIPGQHCYDTFVDDCKCDPWYKKKWDKCVKSTWYGW